MNSSSTTGAVLGHGIPADFSGLRRATIAKCAAVILVLHPWGGGAGAFGQTVQQNIESARQQTQNATNRQRAQAFGEQQIHAQWLSQQHRQRSSGGRVRGSRPVTSRPQYQKTSTRTMPAGVPTDAEPSVVEQAGLFPFPQQALVTIHNPTFHDLNYWLRWGHTGRWTKISLPANHFMVHWWEYHAGPPGKSLAPNIQFNCGLTHSCSQKHYLLESRDAWAKLAELGVPYSFVVQADGTHIDLNQGTPD